MSLNVWILALGIVLVIEGIGPLLFPVSWRNYLAQLLNMEKTVIQRVGGSLVTAGVVLLIMFS